MKSSPVVQVVKKVLPAVVSITVSKFLDIIEGPFSPFSPLGGSGPSLGAPEKKKVQVSGGSGFIVDPLGIVLTNRHVVADREADFIAVTNDNKKYRVEILARDPINDVAILKIRDSQRKTDFPFIELGDSSKLDLGQTVIAVGNALGAFQNTISVGVVSGLSREITAADSLTGQMAKLRGLIQTDAAVNPGNSGGPLVDIKSQAIAINAAMVLGAENISFALPINTAKKDLEDLKKYGKIRQPFLGIRHILISPELQEKFGLPINYGALIIPESVPPFAQKHMAIVPDSPAEKAGLKEGDIILECQKEKITSDNPLQDILQKFSIGKEIKLKILRGNREKLMKVILAEKR